MVTLQSGLDAWTGCMINPHGGSDDEFGSPNDAYEFHSSTLDVVSKAKWLQRLRASTKEMA